MVLQNKFSIAFKETKKTHELLNQDLLIKLQWHFKQQQQKKRKKKNADLQLIVCFATKGISAENKFIVLYII